ncbi:hypothetical protein Mapa_001609 [Marchantia paleacea]|nr:hypothetical protein Mapa_001609 [Marchantia paleacea]
MATGGDSCNVQSLYARGLALQEELRAWGGPGSARLLKHVRGELAFVNRLVGNEERLPPSCPELRSTNFDHLEAVFGILQNPLVSGVTAVMQNFAVTALESSADERELSNEEQPVAHVDIACMVHGRPVWLVVSTRNPRYIMWTDSDKSVKGLRSRLLVLLNAASADAVKQPASILLCFLCDVDDGVDKGLRDEFGAVRSFALGYDRVSVAPLSSSSMESSIVVLYSKDIHLQEDCNFSEVEGGEWLDVEVNQEAPGDTAPSQVWVTYEVGVAGFKNSFKSSLENSLDTEASQHCSDHNPEAADRGGAGGAEGGGDKLDTVVAKAVPPERILNAEEPARDDYCQSSKSIHDDDDNHILCRSMAAYNGTINLDTTALIALVSEASNGGAERLLSLPHEDMVKRFSSMTAFIRKQAISELNRPLVPDIEEAIARREPVVSQYVLNEFNSIVSLVGGPKEKDRAKKLVQRLRVVQDAPSARVMALPLTGKIKSRHKVVFGTGDLLNVPTLTANMAFVRAARQKGMAIEIVEHRPRALTGD